ncbi:MAG: hypothetical protein E4H36_00655 [Spirochaetales bacterium]|nr:MAG: hypothetical protein E4H36_00655 [Spirochaetales bacterium]
MKKFLITFLLLIIAGGAVFYFGWMQIRIPVNSYAVIFFKTGGFEKNPVKAGDFIWRWKKLIPTNATVFVFPSEPAEKTAVIEGVLPSAAAYSSIMEGAPDFTYHFEFSIRLSYSPDSLPELVETGAVSPETLDSWYKDLSDRLAQSTVSLMNERIQSGRYAALSDFSLGGLEEDLLAILRNNYTEVTILSVTPVTVRLPDMELYEIAKRNYLDLVSLRQNILSDETKALTRTEALETRRLSLLAQYGEMLTKYPILLDYLRIEAARDGLSGSFLDSADVAQ